MTDKDGNKLLIKSTKASIDISCDVEHNFKELLKHPHNLEYKKTFLVATILFSRNDMLEINMNLI